MPSVRESNTVNGRCCYHAKAKRGIRNNGDKEDIIAVVESRELEPKYVKALLRENYPLEGCYQRWLEEDVTYMEDLRICIEDHAKGFLRYKDMERER